MACWTLTPLPWTVEGVAVGFEGFLAFQIDVALDCFWGKTDLSELARFEGAVAGLIGLRVYMLLDVWDRERLGACGG